jgi:hypothetical protein
MRHEGKKHAHAIANTADTGRPSAQALSSRQEAQQIACSPVIFLLSTITFFSFLDKNNAIDACNLLMGLRSTNAIIEGKENATRGTMILCVATATTATTITNITNANLALAIAITAAAAITAVALSIISIIKIICLMATVLVVIVCVIGHSHIHNNSHSNAHSSSTNKKEN